MHPPCSASTRRGARVLLALLLALAAPAWSDEIVVRDQPMSGKVVKATSDGLEVETTYGKGNVLVKYEDVTSLSTEDEFVVLNGDEGKAFGRLVGVRDEGKTLLVGNDPATAQAVPVATLFPSFSRTKWDASRRVRAKALFRYWNAKYDLNFATTQATTDTLAFTTGFEVERRKSPTRFLTTGSWRFGFTEDPDGHPSTTKNENELLGAVRGEYDLTKRFYAYLQQSAEYDEIESLSLRAITRGGPGFRIFNEKTYRWSVDAAPAWVYENFFGNGDDDPNSYLALAFGTDLFLTLPWGATFTFRGDYLPNVQDWATDYLLNGKATLAFPMTEWLAFQLGLIDQFDNTPAEDTEKNSLTATAGLALRF